MKKNFFLIIGVLISTSVLADQPAATSPGATNAVHTIVPPQRPATRTARARRPAPDLRTVPLVPGPAVVAVGTGPVNVRGKAGLSGEVITRMTNGEPVTVIEEVTLKNSKADEPSAWAKIVLPDKAHAWVKASYIDPVSKTVTAKTKLNLRGGPGENYSVLGTLEPGAPVKEIETKNGWMQIENSASTYAFMAAQYLKQESATAVATTTEPATTNAIPETTIVTPATNEMVMATTPDATLLTAITNETQLEPTPVEPEPPPQRIVQHEGIVHYSSSIQAPTRFQLVSPDTHKIINYLYTSSKDLDLNRYKGLRIVVTGEEGLDERWRNTPIITIHRIQVLD